MFHNNSDSIEVELDLSFLDMLQAADTATELPKGTYWGSEVDYPEYERSEHKASIKVCVLYNFACETEYERDYCAEKLEGLSPHAEERKKVEEDFDFYDLKFQTLWSTIFLIMMEESDIKLNLLEYMKFIEDWTLMLPKEKPVTQPDNQQVELETRQEKASLLDFSRDELFHVQPISTKALH